MTLRWWHGALLVMFLAVPQVIPYLLAGLVMAMIVLALARFLVRSF